MPDSERDGLVRNAASGDADALQALLSYYHAVLRRHVAARINPRLQPFVDSDDVLQDAYASVFSHFARRAADDDGRPCLPAADFPNAAAFYKWLERVVVNQLRDVERYWRKQKRDVRRRATLGRRGGARQGGKGGAERGAGNPVRAVVDRQGSYHDLLTQLARDDSTPSRKLARQEAAAALATSLARLRASERAVIRLRYFEGLTTAEIAERLGKSDQAVYSLCHRGLKSLRGYMSTVTSPSEYE